MSKSFIADVTHKLLRFAALVFQVPVKRSFENIISSAVLWAVEFYKGTIVLVADIRIERRFHRGFVS